MRQGLSDTQKAADAAADGAAAARQSATTAERAFRELERPYLYIFGAYRLERDATVVGGFEPFVKYSIANYGKTPAVIDDVVVHIGGTSSGTPDDSLRVDGTHWALRGPVFAPGQRRDEFKQTCPEGMRFANPSSGEVVPQINASEDFLFCVRITYRGPFTKGHVTSACWMLDGNNNRFAQYGHSDYNYER